MIRSLVISLNLIVSFLQFNSSTLQFYLNQRETIDKNGNIIATVLSAFNSYLVAYLKLILTPLLFVDELNPHTFTIFKLKIFKVTQFLGFLKTSATFKINTNLLEFFVCEVFTTM